MTFTPALPLGGYAGWGFLKRTLPSQTAAFKTSTELKRDDSYFRAQIGKISTAEELVNDRRLLSVALGAFGLSDDINNKYFIRKVLEEGTLTTGALSTRLADKQYQKMSAAFGFGDFAIPRNKISDFPDKILTAYRDRQFEIAVGAQNPDLRLALNVQRELPLIAAKTTSSENAKWFTVMGNAPLRSVLEKALGLPNTLGALDLDKQLAAFKERTRSQLGSDSMAQFSDPAKVESLIRRFLLRSEVDTFAKSASGNATLQLIQQASANARFRFT